MADHYVTHVLDKDDYNYRIVNIQRQDKMMEERKKTKNYITDILLRFIYYYS